MSSKVGAWFSDFHAGFVYVIVSSLVIFFSFFLFPFWPSPHSCPRARTAAGGLISQAHNSPDSPPAPAPRPFCREPVPCLLPSTSFRGPDRDLQRSFSLSGFSCREGNHVSFPPPARLKVPIPTEARLRFMLYSLRSKLRGTSPGVRLLSRG